MHVKSSYNGLVVPSLIWLSALAAASLGGLLRGLDLMALWPLALVAAVPAVLGLILTPILRKEWAQLLVMFGWLTLAIVACFTFGFVPMALLFLCAPAAAALFEKEKVVEALVMAAIIAGVIYYAGRMGRIPQTTLTETQLLWGKQAGLMATLALIISTLMGASRTPLYSKQSSGVSGSVESEMLMNAVDGGVMRFDDDNQMIGANTAARNLFGIADGTARVPLTSLIAKDKEAQSAITHLVDSARKSKNTEELRLETKFEADQVTYLDLFATRIKDCLLYTSPSPRDKRQSRMPSSA